MKYIFNKLFIRCKVNHYKTRVYVSSRNPKFEVKATTLSQMQFN